MKTVLDILLNRWIYGSLPSPYQWDESSYPIPARKKFWGDKLEVRFCPGEVGFWSPAPFQYRQIRSLFVPRE